MHNGAAQPAGKGLFVLPLEAAALVDSGRAALRDPADRAAVEAAIVAENPRALASCGRIPAEAPRSGRAA
jgi:hypothetical protein